MHCSENMSLLTREHFKCLSAQRRTVRALDIADTFLSHILLRSVTTLSNTGCVVARTFQKLPAAHFGNKSYRIFPWQMAWHHYFPPWEDLIKTPTLTLSLLLTHLLLGREKLHCHSWDVLFVCLFVCLWKFLSFFTWKALKNAEFRSAFHRLLTVSWWHWCRTPQIHTDV